MPKLYIKILLLLALVINAQALEKVTLQLAWKHQFQSAGYYMAKEKGFYKEEGLDVSIREYNGTTNPLDDVLNGKIEFAIGHSSLIHNRLEGKPVVMLAAIFQHSPMILLTKQREDLQKITDLKNKNIMLTGNNIGLAAIHAMLISSGVKKNMYKVQNHSLSINDLINNKTDAILAYISNEPFALDQKSIPYKIFSPQEYGYDFYSDILYTTELLIEKKTNMVDTFRTASLKGWYYAMNHPDETIDIILKKYNTQYKTKEALQFEANAMMDLIDYKHVKIGNITKQKIESIAQVYKLMGFVSHNFSLKNLIYDIESMETYNDNFNINAFFEKIIPAITQPIYNVDTENLPELLKALIKENKRVKAIVIKENLDNETIFQFYRNSDNLIFNMDIPNIYLKGSQKTKNIFYDNEKIAEITVYYRDNISNLNLTQEEKNWLNTHIVKVGVEQWSPVVFSNNGKDIDGIAGDFMKKIIQLTGLKIEVVNDQWSTLINAFKNQKIDILPATYFTEKRSTFGLYSSGYFKMKDYVYVQENNNQIKSLKQLNEQAKKLAIVKGYGTLPKIRQKYPNIQIVLTKNLEESIHKLLLSKVDALYEGGIAVEKTLSNELITGLKGFPESSFKASPLHLLSKLNEPILQSILQKALDNITPKERANILSKWFTEPNSKVKISNVILNKEISFIGLMSTEELVVIFLLFLFFTFFAYQFYLKSNILDVNLKTFNKAIIIFELSMILFIIYEIVVLDRTENSVAKSHAEQFTMIQVADKLRQSSDDLTQFARTFAVTQDKTYEKQYLQTLKIRNGKAPRPKNYNAIYWELDKRTREIRHPNEKKISLKEIIHKLPFSQEEVAKLQESEDNSNDLVNLEAKAFSAIKNNNASYASELLHSKAYYVAKAQIMLPIDEMMSMLYARTNAEIINLDNKISNQFKYILFISLLFILGNLFIYILLVKKINIPIEYLTSVIRRLQSGKKNIEEKTFYKDEIGEMNREFFAMKKQLILRTKDLRKQLRIVNIADRKQQKLIKEIDTQKEFVQTLLDSQEQLIITTDGKTLLSANKTFFDFFAVSSVEEFINSYNANCICDTFNTKAPKGYLQIKMQEETWIEYIISHTFDTTHKAMISIENTDFIFSVTATKLPGNKGIKSAVFTNITALEEVQIAMKNSQQQLELAYDAANLGLWDWYIKEGKVLTNDNWSTMLGYEPNTFTDTTEKWTNLLHPDEIERVYAAMSQYIEGKTDLYHLSNRMKGANGEWIWIDAFGKVSERDENGDPIRFTGVHINIDKSKRLSDALEESKKEIEEINKHIRESIEYAALIQSALIPNNNIIRKYFKDQFIIWHPKDTVGGDIYLFEELRHEDECLLMVIDCTGHGVPGAFVTMLVKAIERQVTAKINHSDEVVSPAKILSIFNKNMKQLLKQENEDSISNAGFDGQIVYYNKKDKILKCASARNEIFYYQDDELKVIKGDRHSIGYKDSNIDFEFTEHQIDVSKETTLYISSDGFWDQNGGEKNLPYGKKRLKKMLDKIHNESMADQQEEFIYAFEEYKGDNEINDDVTVVGLKI